MKIIKGNLWDSTSDIILVTANSFIKSNGELAMGRGAALELKIKYPNLAYGFGKMVQYYSGHLKEYNVLIRGEKESDSKIYGIFQTKYHFKDNSDLELISRSVDALCRLINTLPYLDKTFSMNFPGIGNGGLSFNIVLPRVEKLPDNVSLYINEETLWKNAMEKVLEEHKDVWKELADK
jgi:hypothetical protein